MNNQIINKDNIYQMPEFALLGFLRHQPQHGYAIHQQLTDPAGLGPVWRLKLSQLYALLHKLEAAGLITSTLEPQENRPPRKLFHLTPAGERAFAEWVTQAVDNGRSLRLEFLVKLYFARQEGIETVAHLLAAQQARCQEWLDTEASLVADEEENGRVYGRLVHQFRQGQIQAMLTWLNQCTENIYES